MMRVHTGLLLMQMAGCALLVISTGMLLQGFRAALDTQAGRRLGNPVLATLEALPSPSPDDGRKYFAEAIAAARSVVTTSETVWAARLPGVRAAWQWVRFDPPTSERREIAMAIEPLTAEALDRIALPPVSGQIVRTLRRRRMRSDRVERDCREDDVHRPSHRAIDRHNCRKAGGRHRRGQTEGSTRRHVAEGIRSPGWRARRSESTARSLLLAPPAAELDSGLLDINIVSPNYFEAMGLALISGQLFDGRGRGCRIGVVNEEAAARYFGGNAIGGAVIDAAGRRTDIVGVVRSTSLRAGQRIAEPSLFVPLTQDYLPRMTAVLATPNVNERRSRGHSRPALPPFQVAGPIAWW